MRASNFAECPCASEGLLVAAFVNPRWSPAWGGGRASGPSGLGSLAGQRRSVLLLRVVVVAPLVPGGLAARVALKAGVLQ
eukprot:12971624-Alexandrium_andersonii.AAC.1